MKEMSLLLIMSLLVGCSTSIYVNDINYDVVRDQINKEALTHKCVVQSSFEDGVEVYAINLTPDSAKFITKGYQKKSYHVSNLKRISFTDRGKGSFDGGKIFFVAGSAYGIVRAASSGESIPLIGYLIVATIYGVPTSALGFIAGYMAGGTKEFIFNGYSNQRERPLINNDLSK
jgi:hypothetical protein